MINGFTKFKEKFKDFKDQYVIIGGAACDLIFDAEELPFRATKDIDMVLIIESLTVDFGKAFWEFAADAGYKHINKSTGKAQFYRFSSPDSKEYPLMIELFSRNNNCLNIENNSRIEKLSIGEEVSSLSAILLNDAYYKLLKDNQLYIDDIPVLKPGCVILFKAKAWLDLSKRKANGESIDSKDIKKHKNDIFRLTKIITDIFDYELDDEIVCDVRMFLNEMKKEDVDLKAIDIRGINKEKLLIRLYDYFNLK